MGVILATKLQRWSRDLQLRFTNHCLIQYIAKPSVDPVFESRQAGLVKVVDRLCLLSLD